MTASTLAADAPAPRTYLFVPGARPERFDKALASAADAVILDLEDAVVPAAKADARSAVAAQLKQVSSADAVRLVVRINDVSTPWFNDDLAMLAEAGASCVMLPKAEDADTVARVRAVCPHIGVLALIESARGVLAAQTIAAADGVQRLVFGTLDFMQDLDLAGDPAGLDHAASVLALVSRAAGLPSPVAGVTPEVHDADRLQQDFARARAFGFGAKLCIHPSQVALVHAALQPSAQEVDWAQRVLAALAGSSGAVQVDARMVDRPVELRARRILARAGNGVAPG